MIKLTKQSRDWNPKTRRNNNQQNNSNNRRKVPTRARITLTKNKKENPRRLIPGAFPLLMEKTVEVEMEDHRLGNQSTTLHLHQEMTATKRISTSRCQKAEKVMRMLLRECTKESTYCNKCKKLKMDTNW